MRMCKNCGHEEILHKERDYPYHEEYCVGCKLEEAMIKCDKFKELEDDN